jgi:hypothetical protein
MRAGIVVNVTREDRLRLEAIVADRSAPQKHVWRAKVILATADECGTGRRGSWRRASKGWRATRRASLVRLRVLVGVRYLEHETDPVMNRERGFEGIHEALRILPLYHARSVEHIEKRELVTTDLQLLAASGLRRIARRHHVRSLPELPADKRSTAPRSRRSDEARSTTRREVPAAPIPISLSCIARAQRFVRGSAGSDGRNRR